MTEIAYSALDLNEPTLRDRTRLLYENGLSGIIISLVISTFLVFAIGQSEQPFKFNWWLLMTSILGLRMIDLALWNRKNTQDKQNDLFGLKRFILGVHATALLWCVYVVYMVLYIELLEMTAVIIAIAAMAGGSATVLAAHKLTAMTYAAVLLLPGSFCLIINEEYTYQALGIMGTCFGIVMIIVSKKSADFTDQAIRLKNENAVLVNQMEQQVEKRTRKIYELSNIDPLTGLFNRTAFLKHLGSITRYANQDDSGFALLFIDLDGFKAINDSFGHDAGDFILAQSAARLKHSVEDSHTLCRWGGDEFLIVLGKTARNEVLAQAREIICTLSQPHIWENTSLSVSATIGIANFPEHSKTDSTLIQCADTAMYHQKKHAPSQVCFFDQSMADRHAHELKLKSGLGEALAKDELRLVYQPIVASGDARPVAMEALLRWNFQDQNVPPDQFIPIAEQYGHIREIGAWVMREACLAAAHWHEVLDVPVCVNVSIIQLQDKGFIDLVRQAIEDSGIEPGMLHIEITESVFAADKSMVAEKVGAMQEMGVNVSIDDFGTGYSSLSAMQDLEVNTVKIDKAFIDKLDTSGYAIVTAVIHAARLLKFEVVAEGVETEKQMRKLAKIGVQKLQGFYFSRPLEPDDLSRYIEQHKDDHLQQAHS